MNQHRSTTRAAQSLRTRFLHLLRLVLALGLAAHAAAPSAHALLIRSNPAPGATVPGPNLTVSLTFNTRIDKSRSRIAIRGVNGVEEVLVISPGDDPTTLSAQLGAIDHGRWTVTWQVLARDGHITRGEVPFSVGSRSDRP
jgi:methionine-rich copper-binding protein CopC